MATFAIIASGGQQHKVSPGLVFPVDRLDAEVGQQLTIDDVLLVEQDGQVTVGTPSIKGAKVVVEVVEHFRGKKVRVIKFKRRQNYLRRLGQRANLTKLQVLEVTIGGKSDKAAVESASVKPDEQAVSPTQEAEPAEPKLKAAPAKAAAKPAPSKSAAKPAAKKPAERKTTASAKKPATKKASEKTPAGSTAAKKSAAKPKATAAKAKKSEKITEEG